MTLWRYTNLFINIIIVNIIIIIIIICVKCCADSYRLFRCIFIVRLFNFCLLY